MHTLASQPDKVGTNSQLSTFSRSLLYFIYKAASSKYGVSSLYNLLKSNYRRLSVRLHITYTRKLTTRLCVHFYGNCYCFVLKKIRVDVSNPHTGIGLGLVLNFEEEFSFTISMLSDHHTNAPLHYPYSKMQIPNWLQVMKSKISTSILKL